MALTTQLDALRHLSCSGFLVDFCCPLQVAGFLSVLEAVETREPPAEDKEAGMLTMDDVLPYITAQQKEDLTQRAKVGGHCSPPGPKPLSHRPETG